MSAVWGASVAVAAGGADWIPGFLVEIAGYADRDLLLVLAALIVAVAFQNVDRRGHWAWWTVGALGSAVALVVHIFVIQNPDDARLVAAGALSGWLLLACLAIILSAWWALRSPLAFYRNRGVYLLMLLIPLLAGQVLTWVQWQWVEVGLVLHLMGTLGVVLSTTTHDLPSVKKILRSFVSSVVVTVAMALARLFPWPGMT
jgi:hypothetical protein